MEKLYSSNTLLKIEIGWWVGGEGAAVSTPLPPLDPPLIILTYFFLELERYVHAIRTQFPIRS